eukprot:4943059-Amphidinium_carterae.1
MAKPSIVLSSSCLSFVRPKTWLSSSPLLVKQTLNALPPRERGPDLWHNLVVLDPDDVQKETLVMV